MGRSFRRILTRSKMPMLRHADYEHIVIFFLSLSEQKEGFSFSMPATECIYSCLHAFCVHESSHFALCLDTECVLGRIDAFCGQPIVHTALHVSSYPACPFLRHARSRPGISSAFIGRLRCEGYMLGKPSRSARPLPPLRGGPLPLIAEGG